MAFLKLVMIVEVVAERACGSPLLGDGTNESMRKSTLGVGVGVVEEMDGRRKIAIHAYRTRSQ